MALYYNYELLCVWTSVAFLTPIGTAHLFHSFNVFMHSQNFKQTNAVMYFNNTQAHSLLSIHNHFCVTRINHINASFISIEVGTVYLL